MGVAGNPQHTANGLRYGIDNWLHPPTGRSATAGRRPAHRRGHHPSRAVRRDLRRDGPLPTCYENRALHADLSPPNICVRNATFLVCRQRGAIAAPPAVNVNIAGAGRRRFFPIRVTPAVTLGALELRDDGRLRTYTIASGVCCYDGHQFPADARGNVFVPDSGGHLLGRLKLSGGIAPEGDALLSRGTGISRLDRRTLPPGQRPRRPRRRALHRRLLPRHHRARHLHGAVAGRTNSGPASRRPAMTWAASIASCGKTRPIERRRPNLTRASTRSTRRAPLSRTNGWWRLTAQRLLVEQRDPAAPPLLTDLRAARRERLGTSPRLVDARGTQRARLAVAARRVGRRGRPCAGGGGASLRASRRRVRPPPERSIISQGSRQLEALMSIYSHTHSRSLEAWHRSTCWLRCSAK